MKRKLLLSFIPLLVFLVGVISIDNVSDPYVNTYIHKFLTEFLFALFLLTFFFKLKHVRYLSVVIILLMTVRTALTSFNLYQIDMAFDVNPYIDFTYNMEPYLYLLIYLISFIFKSPISNRILLAIVIMMMLFNVFDVSVHYSIGLVFFLVQTVLMYFTLFNLRQVEID